MEDDKKKFESVFGVPATRNTAPQSLPEGEEEEGSSPPYAVKKSLSTGAPTAGTTAEQITAPPVRLGASGSGLPPAPVKLTHIKEAKIQGFKNFADWNQKIRNQIALVRDILHKMLTVFQKKNQRNENRLNFIKAFYNSFMEDIGKTCQSQLEFANKALPSFEAKDQQAMPVFEQGIREMLIGIRANEKKLQISCETSRLWWIGSVESQISRLQDLRAYFEKNIYEVMNKSLSKHQEFYNLIESCSKGFEVFAEVQERAAKEYDSFMAVFNQAMDEKKKKVEKDLFTEAHKFAGSIRYLILVLKSITDDLIKLQPVAARKEDEYLKSFASSLKQFSLFTQEHFGQFMSATLAKSKFIFEVIDQKFSPSPTPNPNSPLLPPLTAAVPPPSLNAHSSKPTLTPCIPGSTAAA